MKKLFLLAAVVLALPMMAQDEEWRWSQEVIRPSANIYRSPEAYPDVKAIGTPQSLVDVVAAMPAVPTVEIVYNPEVKEQALRTTYMPFEKAMAEALFQNSQRSLVIDNQIKAFGAKQQKTNQKAMAQYNANVNAGLMPSQQEMMEMMMSGEIDPNWPEAKIMDAMAGKFAAKWGVSKEEYLKIMNRNRLRRISRPTIPTSITGSMQSTLRTAMRTFMPMTRAMRNSVRSVTNSRLCKSN